MKTVMICALGYTKSDYHDYPQDWEYVEWSRRNIDSVIHQIRSIKYDRLVAHGLGCFLALLAGIHNPEKAVFIEPYITQFPKQTYVLKYVDTLPDFLFTLLGKDINIPTKNIRAIRACFNQVRQLKQRTIKQIPKIGVYAYRGTAVPPEDIRAERVVVKTNRDPYAIPYSQWKAGV